MAEPKTKTTKESVRDFLNKVEPEEKRKDSFTLLEMFEKITGEKAVMWGISIVGTVSQRVSTNFAKYLN